MLFPVCNKLHMFHSYITDYITDSISFKKRQTRQEMFFVCSYAYKRILLLLDIPLLNRLREEILYIGRIWNDTFNSFLIWL